MTETDELERRLAATLRAKAAQVVVAAEAFVPSDRGEVVPLGEPRRGRRSGWVLAAAAAVLVVLVVGVALVRTDRQTSVSQNDHADRPGVLAPIWVPEGYQLWDVSSSSGPGSEMPGGGPVTVQLFAQDQGPILMVQVGASPQTPGSAAPQGEAVTVRGVAGHVWATTMTTSPDQVPVPRLQIRWEEDGQPISATIDHVGQARALDMLDAMAWTVPGDPLSGVAAGSLSLAVSFSPVLTGSMSSTLLHEVGGVVDQAVPTAAVTTFAYAQGTPTLTSSSEITVRAGGPGSGLGQYYETQLGGTSPQGDGSVETSGASSVTDVRSAVVVWPDGRSVVAIGAGIDPSALVRIARSAAPTDDAALDARRAEIAERVLALPVVATTELPPLTLEVHGEGGTALCAHAGSGPVTCGAVAGVNGGSLGRFGSPGLTVSMIVDGDWYVGAAGTLPFAYTPVSHEYFAPGDTTPSSTPGVTTLADLPVVRTAEAPPWRFLVAAVPARLSDVSVQWDTTSDPSCSQGGSGGSCATGVEATRPSR